jgi:hypothetical protein
LADCDATLAVLATSPPLPSAGNPNGGGTP